MIFRRHQGWPLQLTVLQLLAASCTVMLLRQLMAGPALPRAGQWRGKAQRSGAAACGDPLLRSDCWRHATRPCPRRLLIYLQKCL